MPHRGGLGTKVHLVCDGHSVPLTAVVTLVRRQARQSAWHPLEGCFEFAGASRCWTNAVALVMVSVADDPDPVPQIAQA